MQINRLFEIVYILLSKNRVTAAELARGFGVSTRTIYRDVETLAQAGIPVYMTKGRGGGIGLLPDFVLDKSVLTTSEKAAVMTSLRALSSLGPNDASAELLKLDALLGGSPGNWLEYDFSHRGNRAGMPRLFAKLKTAITERQMVSFAYRRAGETARRVVEPLKLCLSGRGWYLYGYCRTRLSCRFFKLSRIKGLSTAEERFKRPYGQLFGSDDPLYSGKNMHMRLFFRPAAARRIYDELDVYSMQADGSFLAELDMPDCEWLLGWLLSFGDDCVVLEPPELREKLTLKLLEIAGCYL